MKVSPLVMPFNQHFNRTVHEIRLDQEHMQQHLQQKRVENEHSYIHAAEKVLERQKLMQALSYDRLNKMYEKTPQGAVFDIKV